MNNKACNHTGVLGADGVLDQVNESMPNVPSGAIALPRGGPVKTDEVADQGPLEVLTVGVAREPAAGERRVALPPHWVIHVLRLGLPVQFGKAHDCSSRSTAATRIVV